MSLRMICALICALALAPIKPSEGQGLSNPTDYPLVGRVEGYKITHYYEKRFNKYVFNLPDRTMTVEGHVIKIDYEPDGSQPSASALEIYRSYNAVLDNLNGEVLRYSDNDDYHGLIGRFTRNEGNIFIDVNVSNNGTYYELTVVEERRFRPLIQQPGPTPKP